MVNVGILCDRIWEGQRKKSNITDGNSKNIEVCVLLNNGMSDWLQIWMAASSLDVNNIKYFSANWLVFPKYSRKFLP